mmetsp:Transcript_6248/g.8774  ORF Transcript_6248/g.8774 Transcript_6248/m.8774 type:complete len:214 (+) Transcript_6248:1440-2081(+)
MLNLQYQYFQDILAHSERPIFSNVKNQLIKHQVLVQLQINLMSQLVAFVLSLLQADHTELCDTHDSILILVLKHLGLMHYEAILNIHKLLMLLKKLLVLLVYSHHVQPLWLEHIKQHLVPSMIESLRLILLLVENHLHSVFSLLYDSLLIALVYYSHYQHALLPELKIALAYYSHYQHALLPVLKIEHYFGHASHLMLHALQHLNLPLDQAQK